MRVIWIIPPHEIQNMLTLILLRAASRNVLEIGMRVSTVCFTTFSFEGRGIDFLVVSRCSKGIPDISVRGYTAHPAFYHIQLCYFVHQIAVRST